MIRKPCPPDCPPALWEAVQDLGEEIERLFEENRQWRDGYTAGIKKLTEEVTLLVDQVTGNRKPAAAPKPSLSLAHSRPQDPEPGA